MFKNNAIPSLMALCLIWAAAATGCGDNVTVFSSSFLNATRGGAVPLTPGPGAAFVLVRVVNESARSVEFVLTTERAVLVLDDAGFPVGSDPDNPVTRPERKTLLLFTEPNPPANEIGALFPCNETPVNIIGLGENLAPTDIAVFIGGAGAAGAAGFGVSAETIPPLSREAGHFDCGDTVIFRVVQSRGLVGGVLIESFVLAGAEQPIEFTGPNTFVNLEALLESQGVIEEEP